MKDLVIGIDVGTSGCKSIIVDGSGTVVASALEEYPLSTPRPGWAEQDPAHWWAAAEKTLAAVLGAVPGAVGRIAGIGLSGQMHGLVALDRDRAVIRPAFLWNYQRTHAQCRQVFEAVGGEEKLLAYTNNSMLPGYTGGKILWLREEEPASWERVSVILNPKDYIRFRLTGELATEVSDASGTGLFDVKNRKWSDALLAKLAIPRAILPPCFESPEVTGRTTRAVMERTGLPQGTPVVGGGGDSVIQTTGTGLIREGILGLTIGTAGIVSMGLDSFKSNPAGKLQVFCNNAPDKWNIMGVTLAAGGSLQWFRNTLSAEQIRQAKEKGIGVYQIITGMAAEESVPGSRNLLFLPYLTGERCPHTDPNARGAFIGLTLRHGYADMARSVIEGVTYSLRDVYETITRADASLAVAEVRVSGGGSNSPVWRQITADIFQRPVHTVSGSAEGGAYGAALVAGTGCGLWADLSEAVSVLKVETETLPDPSRRPVYDELFGIYTGMYGTLKDTFDRLSAVSAPGAEALRR
jgi:xylulokinase